MLPKTIIHIGSPKAASTLLQNKVFPAIDNVLYIPNLSSFSRPVVKLSEQNSDILVLSDEAVTANPALTVAAFSNFARFFSNHELLMITRSPSTSLLRSLCSQHIKKGAGGG